MASSFLSKVLNFSPAFGVSFQPVILTGAEKVASFMFSPLKFSIARTGAYESSVATNPPIFRVPSFIINVAAMPCLGLSPLSITKPSAGIFLLP